MSNSISSLQRVILRLLEVHREATPEEERAFMSMERMPAQADPKRDLLSLLRYLRDAEKNDEGDTREILDDLLDDLYPSRTPIHKPAGIIDIDESKAIKLDKKDIRRIIIDEISGLFLKKEEDSDGDGDVDLGDVKHSLRAAMSTVDTLQEPSDEEGLASTRDENIDKAIIMLAKAIHAGIERLEQGVEGLPDRGAQWQLHKGNSFLKMLQSKKDSPFALDKKGAVSRILDAFRFMAMDPSRIHLHPIHDEISNISARAADLAGIGEVMTDHDEV